MNWANAKRDRKARQPYRCVWCGEGITLGELYACQSGCFGGRFQIQRWHRECWGAIEFGELLGGFALYGGTRPAAP